MKQHKKKSKYSLFLILLLFIPYTTPLPPCQPSDFATGSLQCLPWFIHTTGPSPSLHEVTGEAEYAYLAFKNTTQPTKFNVSQYVILDILAVAGGGAGGTGDSGGGGGAGGLFHAQNVVLPPGEYTLKVGKGGTGTYSSTSCDGGALNPSENGEDTTISISTSTGEQQEFVVKGGGGTWTGFCVAALAVSNCQFNGGVCVQKTPPLGGSGAGGKQLRLLSGHFCYVKKRL